MGKVIWGTKKLINDSFILTAFEYFKVKKGITGIADFLFRKKI